MSDEGPYVYDRCMDLIMVLMADCFRSIANNLEDAQLAERWLHTSPLAELALYKLGVCSDNLQEAIKKIKTGNFKIQGRSVLRTEEEYQIHKANFLRGRQKRNGKKEVRKRWKWSKNGPQKLQSE